MSIFSFLNPFAKAASGLDTEIAAIQQKANADIAAAKLKHAQAADAAARQKKHADWDAFKAEYEAYLARQTPASPSAAPTGSTGPTGA